MAWPLSQDFNEAIQNPSSAFSDADLKAGKVVTTPLGVPMPRSGNYADVYQITAADGRSWAVKCFTRAVAADLQARYAAIAGHLAQANLPFTVGFEFLADGIRVKGQSYPVVKMQWVEGFALNTFVKDNLNRATILESMLSLWVRLCRRLRETGMAHCDLQHGNVILVPAEKQNSLGLKLVDYDGMFVPALAGKSPGEAGHASFQHPQRVQINAYSADLDKFPHLVVATALRGLLVGGKALWDKYDTGDNLLFTAKDFTAVHQSKVMRELWDGGDPFTVGLLSHLVIACSKPLAQTPWLDTLMPEGRPPVLTPSQERQAMQLLGLPVQGAVPSAPAQALPPQPPKAPPAAARPNPELGFEAEGGSQRHKALAAKNNSKMLYGAIAAGVLAAVGIGVGVVAFGGGKKNSGSGSIVQNNGSGTPIDPKPIDPKPMDPKPPIDPPMDPKPPITEGKEAKVIWSVAVRDGEKSFGRGVVYSLDGSKLIVPMTATGHIGVYDAKTGQLISKFQGHEAVANVMAAPLINGKVLSAGIEPKLFVWEESTGSAVSAISPRSIEGPLDLLQTDREGKYVLLAGGKKGSIIDLDTRKEILAVDLIGAGMPGRAAAMLAPDGSKVLSLTNDGKIKMHPLPSGPATEAALAVPNAAVIVAWSPAKGLAVVRTRLKDGKIDTRLHVVNTATGESVKTLSGYGGRCAFTPDGGHLVAATSTDAVHFLDPLTGEVKAAAASKSAGGAFDLAVSPDGGSAAFIGANDHQLALVAPPWNPTTVITPKPPSPSEAVPKSRIDALQQIFGLAPKEPAPINSATVDREGKLVVYCTDAKVTAVSLADKKEKWSFTLPAGSAKRVWATDADTLAVEVRKPDDATELRLVKLSDGSPGTVIPIRGPEAVTSMAVAASGSHAAACRRNGHVGIYDLKTLKLIFTIHPWNKDETPPETPLVTAFFSDPPAKFLLNRDDRFHTYNMPDFTHFNWGKEKRVSASDVEDFADDADRLILRDPAAPMPGKTRFFVKKLGKDWSVPPTAIEADGTGSEVSARFLGGGESVVTVYGDEMHVYDSDTGKSSWGRGSGRVVPVTRSVVAPGRRMLVLTRPKEVAVFAPKGAAGSVVQAIPLPPMPVPADPPVPARKPVPNDDALKSAEKNVKEIFKDLYAKKQPAERRKLAEQLLKTAGETANDPAAKFFLLHEVQAIAVELYDAHLGAKAIDLVEADFDVDGGALRVSLVERIGNTASKSDALKALAETCSEMVEELADKGEFDKALKLTTVGLAALARANLQPLGRDLEARQNQLRRQKEAYEPVKAALEILKTNPMDAEANGIVGKYRCFVLGRWAEGLPNLAAGADDTLKKAAALDLSVDAETTAIKKADAWWTWAQAQPDAEKTAALSRAKFWYAKILAAGTTGIDRATAENRLAFSQGGTDYRPGLVLDVFPVANVKKKTVKLMPTADLLGADYKDAATWGNSIGIKINGFIVAPSPGRYKIVLEGNARVFIKLSTPPEMLINITDADSTAKKDAFKVLPAKPVAIYIEAMLFTQNVRGVAASKQPQSIVLKWLRPGSKTEEPIPPEVFFHDKTKEATLTDK